MHVGLVYLLLITLKHGSNHQGKTYVSTHDIVVSSDFNVKCSATCQRTAFNAQMRYDPCRFMLTERSSCLVVRHTRCTCYKGDII